MAKHEATAFSPYYLMHGREAICPLDLLLETPRPDAPTDVNQYADEMVERLKRAFTRVVEHEGGQMERMKRRYDANVRQKAFGVNEFVWYYYPRRYQGRSSKWRRYYVGPYRVEKVLNDVNYLIRKTPRSKAIVSHIDKLRKYYGEPPACFPETGVSVGGRLDEPQMAMQLSVAARF